MQRKNISILLFILVFIGVPLLANTGVWAGINLNDDHCDFSGTQNEVGLCAEVYDDNNTNVIYVIQICVTDLDAGDSGPCNDNPSITADMHITGWPDVDTDTGNVTYTYSFRQANTADENCSGVPALNYLYLTVLQGIPPIVASDPSGPKLLTCTDGLKECAEECNPNTVRVKMSFSYSCSRTSRDREPSPPRLFSLTFPPGTNPDTQCGSITAVTRDGCWMGGNNSMIVPSGVSLFAAGLSFPALGLEVTRDYCTGAVTEESQVTFDGATTRSCEPVICFGDPTNSATTCIDLVDEGKRVGPPFFGCVLDDRPIRMYGYGPNYFCADAPSSP